MNVGKQRYWLPALNDPFLEETLMEDGNNKRKYFEELQNAIGNAAKTVADGAVHAGNKAAEIAIAAGANAASAISDAKDTASKRIASISVPDLIDEAKASIAEKTRESELREERHYRQLVAAQNEVRELRCKRLMDELGESPLALSVGNSSRVKASFPIPREQTVIWSSAEFDLRPSGVALTDQGVFIKSDAKAFAFPGNEKDTRSSLTYIRWNYFEPAWLGEISESNPLMSVDRSCSIKFAEACRKAGAVEHELRGIEDIAGLETEVSDSGRNAAIVSGANTLSAESAVFAEQRATPAGHGEMAEEAITKLDKLHGHDARVCGRDNKKNGPDRIVDGVFIQTKYYNSARGSLEACFDPSTSQYRYIDGDGNPMQLEVAKDQYDSVLRGFEEKIRRGKVPGVKDPKMAKEIVRKGRLTYEQAVNLTKPGTIESLKYDAATGAIQCTCAFGISFLAASFNAYRKTGSMKESIHAGFASGVQVFGLSFAQHMIVSQLSRTSLANTLMKPSQIVVQKLGHKTSATIVNGLRTLSGKRAISGAAASKQLAKIMRSSAITSAITFAVFSVPETYKLASGKASGAQYAKNLTSLAGSIAGGVGGAAAAGAAAAKIGAAVGTAITPGVGTAVGIVGGVIGGAAGSFATNTVSNVFYEGDAASFTRFFNALVSSMSVEYMLADDEVDKLVSKLNNIDSAAFKSLLEQTMISERQEQTVRDFLVPIFESVIEEREPFGLPPSDEIESSIAAYLSELNDSEEKNLSDCE